MAIEGRLERIAKWSHDSFVTTWWGKTIPCNCPPLLKVSLDAAPEECVVKEMIDGLAELDWCTVIGVKPGTRSMGTSSQLQAEQTSNSRDRTCQGISIIAYNLLLQLCLRLTCTSIVYMLSTWCKCVLCGLCFTTGQQHYDELTCHAIASSAALQAVWLAAPAPGPCRVWALPGCLTWIGELKGVQADMRRSLTCQPADIQTKRVDRTSTRASTCDVLHLYALRAMV